MTDWKINVLPSLSLVIPFCCRCFLRIIPSNTYPDYPVRVRYKNSDSIFSLCSLLNSSFFLLFLSHRWTEAGSWYHLLTGCSTSMGVTFNIPKIKLVTFHDLPNRPWNFSPIKMNRCNFNPACFKDLLGFKLTPDINGSNIHVMR